MTTTKADLIALAARVEALSGPDREVDCRIEAAIGRLAGEFRVIGPPTYQPERYFSGQDGIDWIGYDLLNLAPKHTASIDAAMSLVPEAMEWVLYSDGSCEIGQKTEPGCILQTDFITDAATPALALTAAALRAQASLMDGGEG